MQAFSLVSPSAASPACVGWKRELFRGVLLGQAFKGNVEPSFILPKCENPMNAFTLIAELRSL